MRARTEAPGSEPGDPLFTPLAVGSLSLPNRIIRSATYEGMAHGNGVPQAERLTHLYTSLVRGGVGAIITGFVAVSQDGRAMHPAQCGLDTNLKAEAWAHVLDGVRKLEGETPLIAQLAHTGRQTRSSATGRPLVGASSRKCRYFRQRVETLDQSGIQRVIRAFADAARYAQGAGFNGVQIHAAHGYLIHQFLSPWTNSRRDEWGDRSLLCTRIVEAVREACGPDFGVWVKLSGTEDRRPGITVQDTVRTSERLQEAGADLIEVSFGTMENALNIIRGDCPVDEVLRVNPLYSGLPTLLHPLWKVVAARGPLRRMKPFSPIYNLEAAKAVKEAVSIPVAVVGGIRTKEEATRCLDHHGLDAIGLCRPLIREPDLPARWRKGTATESTCTNCNLCTVYCDSGEITKCRTEHRASN